MPLGSVVVAAVNRELRVTDKEAGALVLETLSFTVTLNVAPPALAGVPESIPVELLTDNPVGNDPLETVQLE